MKKLKTLLFCLFGTIIALMAFVSQEDDILQLIEKFNKYSLNHISEKVYLQMDKPYYAVGDQIWFKCYVTTTDGGLSNMSKIVYVDFINEQNEIIEELKLPLMAGVAAGDIKLSDKLEEGNYRIKAYTQWMRNADERFFFDKTVKIGKSWSNDVFVKTVFESDSSNAKKTISKAHIQYLNKENEPLKSDYVDYQITLGGKNFQSGREKTNEKGEITVTLNKSKIAQHTRCRPAGYHAYLAIGQCGSENHSHQIYVQI